MPDTSKLAPMTITLPSDQDHTGRNLGDEEIELLTQAIRGGTLTSTKGRFVKEFERGFAELHGVPHAVASASGSAALHTAIAAIDPEPGDEIVTTSVTDMGALTAILYQAAIPVFADIDPATGNVSAATIEAVLSERTRAIVVTHLFGHPADMAPIMALAEARGLPVIEDCAQAFLAESEGRRVGTIGTIGCFSLQQGKHITAGEGGICITRDDALARRMVLFVNKGWGYGDPQPDHYFLAPNYRMTELQGAVAVAQLVKLEAVTARRVALAERLTGQLTSLSGLDLPVPPAGDRHTYWRYCPLVDDRVPGGSPGLGARLRLAGIAAAPRYIQKPAFRCEVFAQQRTFGSSGFPFNLARPEAVDYREERFPGTTLFLHRVIVLPWNDRFSEEDVDFIGGALRAGLDSGVA